MGLGDALDDRQAKADASMVVPRPISAPLKRFDQRRDQPWAQLFPRVPDRDYRAAGLNTGRDADGSVIGPVVDDRVVDKVRLVSCSSRACEPLVGATSPETSMVTPCFSASGNSVSVASSTSRDRSTGPRVNDR